MKNPITPYMIKIASMTLTRDIQLDSNQAYIMNKYNLYNTNIRI